ncbi:MAG: molybdopterin molybdotransferase MoeA [Oscillospiraceae bacterium]|nr:molybdopterin molybdotransferase MoeA [Oscillospiraceae bacterium]
MRPDNAKFISKADALALLFSRWTPTPETEQIPVADCVGRVLAKDVTAQYNLPVVRASMMDGVAVKSEYFANDLPDTAAWRLGAEFVRADTGDDFDDAYDAVVAIENVTLTEDGGITFAPDTKVAPGTNVKPCGAEVTAGAVVATAGTLLTETDLAAIAMSGAESVTVLRRPRVGFLPTGSELVPVGAPLARGQGFDTNSPMAAALLRSMGAEPVMHPIVRDDPAALSAAFRTLLPQCDVLLVNAGTSKGGEDYCARLLSEQGEVLFHGVAAVPGRPMSMAIVDGKPVVNLSGPAFAAFYSLDWAARGIICRYLGQPVPQRETLKAVLTEQFGTPPIFSMMAAFRVRRGADGNYLATPLSVRGPKAAGTAAVLGADAVYISTPGEAPHEAGEEIELELLRNRAALG